MKKPNYRILRNGNPACNRACNFNKKDICHHSGTWGVYRPVLWHRNDICLAGLLEQRDKLRGENGRLERENKKLRGESVADFHKLAPHEQEIIREQIRRLLEGNSSYGEWEPGQYNTEQETLEEVMDALNYVADRLVTLREMKNGD